MTLYLKYRSQTIDELDLEAVRTSLKNIIKSGNIPHAFLFSGPKGTGKTSAARILAKILNCESTSQKLRGPGLMEPCNQCSQCMSITKGNNIDVIEMDAASNRGIDDIRSLKEGIYLVPASAKKKVYIIDEAHMLTLEAANAFLKTLEEPPEHVYFILATTNPEKLPQTVVSRLTQINFTKATAKDISRQLKRVATGEKIEIEEKAIGKIAKLADGSFRDAIKLFETLSFKSKKIAEKDVEATIFGGDLSLVFLRILKTGDGKAALIFVENIVVKGVQFMNFVKAVFEELHLSLLAKNGIGEDRLKEFSLEEILNLNQVIGEVKGAASFPDQLALEVAIVKYCLRREGGSIPVISTKRERVETLKPERDSPARFDTRSVSGRSAAVARNDNGVVPLKERPLKVMDNGLWQKILESLHEKNMSIEALLRGTKPMGFDGTTLSLGVYYQFHKDRLEEVKNVKILEDACKVIFNVTSVKLELKLIEKPHSAEASRGKPDAVVAKESLTPAADKDIIDAAKEIFG